MGATSTNDSVPGSNIAVLTKPVNGTSPCTPTTSRDPYALVPPLISTLPSCMIDMPLQNMSQPMGMVVIFLVDRYTAPRPADIAGLGDSPPASPDSCLNLEMMRTFPVCRRAACTGLIGVGLGRVVHRPVG